MKPFISIVIPTYQRCDRLEIALDSVLKQTYNNYEILIIDDGSTDGTKEMVKSIRDPRIIYYWQRNSGCPANPRNKGVKLARGEWVAFLDSDDWWAPEKLRSCVKQIKKNRIDFIYHDAEIVTNKKNCLNYKKKIVTDHLKKPVLIDLLLKRNLICNSSVVVRKKLLVLAGYFNERKELKAAEDYNMWLKVAKFTDNFFYLPKTLGYYFIHNDNISSKNMSIPIKYAVSEFIEVLNFKQKI